MGLNFYYRDWVVARLAPGEDEEEEEEGDEIGKETKQKLRGGWQWREQEGEW